MKLEHLLLSSWAGGPGTLDKASVSPSQGLQPKLVPRMGHLVDDASRGPRTHDGAAPAALHLSKENLIVRN